MKLDTAETLAVVFSLLSFLWLIIVINFSSGIRFSHPGSLQGCSNVSVFTNDTLASPTLPEPEFRILVGVITYASRYNSRHQLRLIRSLEPNPVRAQVDVRFVVCTPDHEDDRVLVSLEVLRYDDIMTVECRENMNNGKTYAFLSVVGRAFKRRNGEKPYYDYVMKTDDDTYIRFVELVEALRPLPREDLYFGHMVPENFFNKGDPLFMAGMGYVLSWDIVEWITTSEMVRNHTVGEEDKLVGAWLRDGARGKNMYDSKPSEKQIDEWRHRGNRVIDNKATQYDFPRSSPYRFMARTISVHRLKDNIKWAKTLKYFNVTVDLKPSVLFNFTAE